ncbi:FtsX-like permease family protein [Eubacteriales bacterium DFI.9.88]|uniref:ABC transporter permease n=1 Tax=Hominibacterium faecale TaxID=2839743 RepID=UPI0022B294A6|nr:FtsX-like permease family protein [Hominibacterium faecale]MDE8732242.1 FtsX-like permease family protein [Eubacteriales bacterium DFI.9.88]
MLANNNRGIITRMAKSSLAGNKRKNGMLIIAISLASFMLFSILTVGGTYFRMQQIQEIRMQGADFDAYIYGGFTDEQKSVCEANTDIEKIGVEAMAAWAEKTAADDTLHTAFLWADDTMWKEMKRPAMEWVKGRYPTKDNEVMATKEALKDCGLQNLGIGDSFEITYGDKLGSHTKRFTITGMWGGYGDKRIFYVSKSFFQKSGFQLSDYGRGFLYLKFQSSLVSQKTQDQLKSSLDLGQKQRLIFTAETAWSIQLLLGMAGLILITCLSAYLLVYNILSLSVSGNIRYYGLLRTVGMTGRQINGLIRKQMLFTGAIGMAGGFLLGAAASFFLIPAVVKTLGIRQTDIQIVFHPLILLAAVLLVGATVFIGSRKPARIAAEITPMEALGYRGLSGKTKARRTGKGQIVWRMAKDQLFKDKKKTFVVVLSLAAALSVFLCLATLIASHGPRTIVSNYMDADLLIKNDTIWKEDQGQWKQLMDDDFLSQLPAGEISQTHKMLNAAIAVPWEPDFSDGWMKQTYDMWMEESYENVREDYKLHPETYYSYLTGIDQVEFEYLNSTLDEPVDEKAFLEGKTCILFRNDLDFNQKELREKQVSCFLLDQREKSCSFDIAGLTDDTYYAMPGLGPTIIISDGYFKRIVDKPLISKLTIQYQQEYDENTEEQIKKAMNTSPKRKDFSYDSKLEEMKQVEKAQNNMMGIGMGITVLLALIGIMNYINTVCGSIQNRQVELAVMESVGMTDRQTKKMLVREGVLYAVLSLMLTGTAGLGITYLIYQSMNYIGIAFSIPVIPVLIMIVVIGAICIAVPLIAYRHLSGNHSVVERIRGNE